MLSFYEHFVIVIGTLNYIILLSENPFKPTLIDPKDSVQIGKILLLQDYNPSVIPLDLYKLNVEELKIDRKRIKRVIAIEGDHNWCGLTEINYV